MSPAIHAWRGLGTVPPDALVRDRLALHRAVQLISSFGQTLLEPRADDSHRSMSWVVAGQAFAGRSSGDGLRVVLEVPTFRLLLRGTDQILASFDLSGRATVEARSWLGAQVTAATGRRAVTLEWPEYTLPAGMPAPDAPMTPSAAGLEELARWYGDAHTALSLLVQTGPEASEILCWPHHFDIASLLTLQGGEGVVTRYIGVGLSPGDDSYGQPYFYVNGWPSPEPGSLPPLSRPGTWHTNGWIGAVLTGTAVVEAGSVEAQRVRVTDFLIRAVEAVKWALP